MAACVVGERQVPIAQHRSERTQARDAAGLRGEAAVGGIVAVSARHEAVAGHGLEHTSIAELSGARELVDRIGGH
jgi:hypothetical protein